MELHSEQESYRRAMSLRTPDGEAATVIVLRRGSGAAARVWLTFQGAMRTTVAMNDLEANQLVEVINATRSP